MIDPRSFTVLFRDRQNFAFSPAFRVEVGRYSWAAVGGPKQAELFIEGSERDLLNAINMLRYGVTIYNPHGDAVWWGYVERVDIPNGPHRTIVADLDNLYNRVAVAYTLVGVGEDTTGPRATTDWVEDADSIAQFGQREMLYTIGGTSATVATQYRAMVLAETKLPTAASTRSGSQRATITCRGWWTTLEWLYCDVPPILALSYEGRRNASLTLGTVNGNVQIVQTFRVGPAAIALLEMSVWAAKVGAPGDDLKIAVYTLASGNPDAELASATISGAAISTTAAWVTVTLSGTQALTANTSYALVVSRSGSPNNTNYFRVYYDSGATYTSGALKRSTNGTSYSNVTGDAAFRLFSNEILPNETQIYNMLHNFGQFFTDHQVEDASGLTSESYRNGDSDALEEVERLMAAGTTNTVRYLSRVEKDRRVRVFDQEPASTAPRYYIDREDRVWMGQVLIDSTTCPVGFWAEDKDVPEVLTQAGANVSSRYFIEEMEYDPETDRLTLTPIGILDLLDAIMGAQYG